MMAIKAALTAPRRDALRRAGAGIGARHQPAHRALLGYKVVAVPAREDGTVHVQRCARGARKSIRARSRRSC
jgi:hypothetical protein